MSTGEGERLHNARRKRFWKIVGWLAIAGGVGGFVSGFAAGYADGSGKPLPDWMLTAATVAIVFSVVIGAYASWRYFAAVDEVEIADNLWSSLVGFYVFGFLFPAWWMLHWVGRAPAPDAGIIYAAAMLSAVAAYGVRKWRSR
jgi:hypothetical protein